MLLFVCSIFSSFISEFYFAVEIIAIVLYSKQYIMYMGIYNMARSLTPPAPTIVM